MVNINKGVYPDWMLEENIIDRILRDLKERGGQLSYNFLLNPESSNNRNQRIQNILSKMDKEHLIHAQNNFIELEEEGKKVLLTGYEKYVKAKRWALILKKLKTGIKVLSYVFIATLLGLTIYRIIVIY